MTRVSALFRGCGLGRNFLMGVTFGIFLSYLFPRMVIDLEKISRNFQITSNKTQGQIALATVHKNITVLCWIMTSPGNHLYKAIHVKKTWGKRCTKILFMSTKEEPKLPSIALPNVKEGRDWLWAKTKEALKYIYAHHLDDADWILKADDDTYVIMENLWHLLKGHDPSHPYLFGYEFITDWLSYKYMSGGAGYVMSKEALKRFVEKALYMNDTNCYTSFHNGMEDIEVSKCLISVNTTFGNSRDSRGRERFNYGSGSADMGQFQNLECCSDTAISFHYVQPHEMYYLEYLLYHLRPLKMSDDENGLNFPSVSKAPKMQNSSQPKGLSKATAAKINNLKATQTSAKVKVDPTTEDLTNMFS